MKNTLLSAMGFEDADLKTAAHDEIMLWIDSHAEKVAAQALAQCGINCLSSRVVKKSWEVPITANGGRTIGFIDMYMQVDIDFGREDGLSTASYGILVEAKSKITSLGEVIRQIRAYEMGRPSNVGSARMSGYLSAIVCPDSRFSSVLNSQSIAFIQSPSDPAPLSSSGGLF